MACREAINYLPSGKRISTTIANNYSKPSSPNPIYSLARVNPQCGFGYFFFAFIDQHEAKAHKRNYKLIKKPYEITANSFLINYVRFSFRDNQDFRKRPNDFRSFPTIVRECLEISEDVRATFERFFSTQERDSRIKKELEDIRYFVFYCGILTVFSSEK